MIFADIFFERAHRKDEIPVRLKSKAKYPEQKKNRRIVGAQHPEQRVVQSAMNLECL